MTYDARFRRTKIVATIGPASATPEVLGAMIDAGVNVVRVNSSHGTPDVRVGWMRLIRDVAQAKGRHVAILVDLQGPRIRVGALASPRMLETGADVVFAPEAEATGDEIPTTYADLANDVVPGKRILLDDGLLAVEVEGTRGSRVDGRVVYGGELKGQKGINLPGIRVSAPAVTEKDREDVARAVAEGVDYIGISFVSEAEEVAALRRLVPATTRLVAKIERAAALESLDAIVDAADAVMVARGDLGVELPFEEVPLAQKHLIRLANRRGRPVITATQMLESMIEHPRPTRAEASDVANAILDGTDAVMLSAETAVGAYPVRAVEAMARIIGEIERSVLAHDVEAQPGRSEPRAGQEGINVEDAIAVATTAAAELLRVPVVVCFTRSGFTPRKVSAYRPRVPIVGLSTELATCRQLALVWGVMPELADRVPDYNAMLDIARDALLQRGYAKAGDLIAVTAGVPFDVPGTTNLLKVEVV
ncbi:MAG TPA: pyruvate kinase [Gemmatimonadales bacterium]|nr:pyruvate kinase [Gemmatimonadales bacterium]